MPVLVLTARPLAGDELESTALSALRRAVAGALGLDDNGVIATLVHSARSSAQSWPVLIGYGRPRDSEQMTRALDAARQSVANSWHTTADAVWAQWLLITP